MRREERKSLFPEIAGAKLDSLTPEALLQKIKEIKAERGVDIMVANPMAVCGREHVLSAYMHSKRSVERGDGASKELYVEFLRYLTGERQISRAMEKGGVRGKSAVILAGCPVDYLIDMLGVERDDSFLECTEEKLRYLGIGDKEEALELVAMVAIL